MQAVNPPFLELERAPKPAGLITGASLVSLAIAVFAMLLFSWIATEVREGGP